MKINIPLLYFIQQVPFYAKCLKQITHISKRAFLIVHISFILSCQPRVKNKDHGYTTVSCIIGDILIEKTWLDLGAIVSFLSFSVVETLDLGKLKKTVVTLHLVDLSIKVPKRIVKDVLIKASDFVFLSILLFLNPICSKTTISSNFHCLG